MKKPIFKRLNANEKKIFRFSKNLDLANKKHKHSYFTPGKELFCIKFPVLNKKFDVYSIENSSTGSILSITIFISDKRNIRTRGKYKNYIAEINFHNDDIKHKPGERFNLTQIKEIKVIIYNDIENSNMRYIKGINKDFSLLQPDEQGDGVIIEGP